MSTSLYPPQFYADRRQHTRHAARAILGALPEGLSFGRVADVGCGTGTFLSAALDMGAREAFGIEGNWVTSSMLDDPQIVFTAGDLEQPFNGPRVDLVLSLEVAEHLSPARADGFVSDLVAIGPAILFSAAVPGQGGVGHLNEQWQSFWANRFADHGYLAVDSVRPRIWTDEAIPAWYRQNTIVYIDQITATRLKLTPVEPALLDRIHPAYWERANRELSYANALPESEVLQRRAKDQL